MGDFKKGDLLRVVSGYVTGVPTTMMPRGVRVVSTAERERLEADTWYQTPGDDGETRLIPRHRTESIKPGTLVIVLRARASAPRDLCWGKWALGHVLVLDPSTGHEYYIKRHFLEVTGASEVESENA